jgi:hypothetical protein
VRFSSVYPPFQPAYECSIFLFFQQLVSYERFIQNHISNSHEDEKVRGIEAQKVQEKVLKTKLLFSELEISLESEAGPRMFSLEVP